MAGKKTQGLAPPTASAARSRGMACSLWQDKTEQMRIEIVVFDGFDALDVVAPPKGLKPLAPLEP